MGIKDLSLVGGLLLIVVGLAKAQEDSLKSALNAVDRRQQDLSEYSGYGEDHIHDYGYSLDGPDSLAFLNSDYNSELEKNSGVDRLLLDYLKEGGTYPEARRVNRDDSLKKRISSPFRERLEEDREKQLEEVAQNYLANSDNDEDENYDEEEYSELIRELLDKYKNYPVRYNRPRVYLNGETRNKRYYPMFISETNLRKRNKYHSSEEPAYYNPYSNDEYYDSRFQEDDQWYPNIPSKRNRRQKLYPVKRFPVSKRSGPKSEIIHEHKRSTTKKESAKTDPKVAKDLSNIFGTVATEKPTTTKMEKVINKPKKEKTKPSKTEERSPVNTKEEVPVPQQDKPIEIKKKSIDWSDYFGLDRRKKSENNLDNEWLMERYHKAVSLNSKRTAEYALQSFKNHDEPTKKESSVRRLDPSFAADESKLAEMNKKLKKMEDAIIDDALKYTGAHQGTSDSQEIQEVKDRVISRLAAAYNLEKMRRALGEYKLSMAQERQKFAQQSKDKDNYDISEEKRVSVPRKQAVDDEREKLPEGDNDIKCSQGDENCEEQNYRTPPEVLEQTTFEECPKVQRACSEVATVLGYYARVFETACNMHQMCLLCSNNSWFAPTRQCNVLFLSKAFELCDGKEECQKEAQRSVRYLLDVSRSLRAEPMGECELACPDAR